LKNKLVAGKNQHNSGYQKFASAQFFENLTKEQYSGEFRPRITGLSISRDSLNPLLNAQILKERLALIEHYKAANGGHMFHHWPYYFMKNMGTHMNRYKFNYGLKAFAAYVVYRDLQNWQHMS